MKKLKKFSPAMSHPWHTGDQTVSKEYYTWLQNRDSEIKILESLSFGGERDDLNGIGFLSHCDLLALNGSDSYKECCLGLTNKPISIAELEEPYYLSL